MAKTAQPQLRKIFPMKTTELLHGCVKRLNAVVTLDEGTDIEVWDARAIQTLSRGQRVTLTYDGKAHRLLATQISLPYSLSQEEVISIVQRFLKAFPTMPHSDIVRLAQLMFEHRKS
jgi:hypothetical protein